MEVNYIIFDRCSLDALRAPPEGAHALRHESRCAKQTTNNYVVCDGSSKFPLLFSNKRTANVIYLPAVTFDICNY